MITSGFHKGSSVVSGRQHILAWLIKRLGGVLVVVLVISGGMSGVMPGVMPGPARADDGARAVVEALNGALLESMRAGAELGYQGRYRRLEPALRRTFEFDFMARIAVGRRWADLSPAEQARVTDLFAEMSIANFAARFDRYGGERFEVVAEGPGPRDAVVIQSRIVRPSEPPVGLDYVLREFADGWRIIDVLLDSKYSELARQHAEFAAVLKDGGVPELIATLERKIKTLAGPT
jgi:phospholipid transport system substrate-binding protein